MYQETHTSIIYKDKMYQETHTSIIYKDKMYQETHTSIIYKDKMYQETHTSKIYKDKMYQETHTSIIYKDKMSIIYKDQILPKITTNKGVKQGDNLSPLFSKFISMISQRIWRKGIPTLYICKTQR